MADEPFTGLPEVMASLRRFGSTRRTAGSAEHLRFFAPLLEARRAAAAAPTRADAIGAFDAANLVRALDRAVADLAGARFAARAPARRAFAAALADQSGPLRAALVRLGELALAARRGTDAEWEAWVEQLRVCFAAADALWPVLDHALAPSASERRP